MGAFREMSLNTIRFGIASTVLAAISIAVPAKAATFLDGAYGSKEGCIYARTGESSGADDFLLLKDDGVTTSVSACEFKGMPKTTANGFTIKAICEADGEVGPEDTATLTRSAKGYTVSFPDGTKLGPMPKCR